MVIYARAWHTGSCLCIRKGPFEPLILAKTHNMISSTYEKCCWYLYIPVQVLSVNKAVWYAKNTTCCQHRPFLRSEQSTKAFWKAAPSLSLSLWCLLWGPRSLHEISPLLGFIYKRLRVQNSVCWVFCTKKNPQPWSFSPSCTCICTEWGIHLPALTLRARDKWTSMLAVGSRNQTPSAQTLIALFCTIWVCTYTGRSSLAYFRLECQVYFSKQFKNLS